MDEKKPGGKITLSTVGAAFVTYVVMVSKRNNLIFILLSFHKVKLNINLKNIFIYQQTFNGIIIFASFIFFIFAIKVSLGYASCIATGPNNEHPPSMSHICHWIGYAGATAENTDPTDVLVSLFRTWLTLLLTATVGIPQILAAWDMLQAISKNNEEGTLMTYLWTVRHQKIQSLMIAGEMIIIVACYAILYAGWQENNYGLELIWNATTKILIGRLICCFVVDVFLNEVWTGLVGSAAANSVVPSVIMFKLDKNLK